MNEQQALQVFNGQIPETGEVDYEAVENALRATGDGRSALRFFHKFRRSGAIVARINRATGGLFVSRPAGQVG